MILWVPSGMKTAADRVTYRFLYARILKAMSLEKARDVLGFPPGYAPSEKEVGKAQRRKTFEHHPDRGGDSTKMVEVNVAADVLTGKQRAKPDYTPPPPSAPDPATPPGPPPEPEIPEVSFEEAMAGAHISPRTYWMWITDLLKRRVPDEELMNGGLDSAWVCYGRNYESQTHEFLLVAVGAYWDRPGEPSTWWVGKPLQLSKRLTAKQAIARGMPTVMKQLPGLIKRDKVRPIGSGPVGGRRYLGQKDFEEPRGTAVSIQAWLEEIGEDKQKPLTVIVELRTVDYSTQMVVIVNGHETVLDGNLRIEVERKIGRKMFSKSQLDYWDGKKNLTRMRSPAPLYELFKLVNMDLPQKDLDEIREYLKRTGYNM